MNTRRAFTIIEAVICSIVVALMAVAAGGAVAGATRARTELATRALAIATADMLLAEILTRSYADPQTPDAALGTDAGESTLTRSTLDDVDDYNGLILSPITDRSGEAVAPVSLACRIKIEQFDTTTMMPTTLSRTGLARITIDILQGTRVIATRVAFRARQGIGAVP